MRWKGKHEPVVREDSQGRFYAVCTCGQNSGPNHVSKVERWRAEDWCHAHAEEVEHALAVLHRSSGSLKIERDHARKMLDDPNTPPNDKAMWQILFNGAERRLRDDGPPDPDQHGLF